jgi:hypothetical protein
MEFELKKVKYHEDMSEETPCFSAELWQDNRFMAYVGNRGHGGCNDITPAKGLKYQDVAHFDNLDTEADIFGMVYDEDDRKKFQSKGLVLKKENRTFTVKFPLPISKFKNHPQFKPWINKHTTKFISEGYIILNNNI